MAAGRGEGVDRIILGCREVNVTESKVRDKIDEKGTRTAY